MVDRAHRGALLVQAVDVVAVTADQDHPILSLTPAQQRCVELLLRGLSDDEIGAELGISASTASLHLREARRRLGGKRTNHRFWARIGYALGYARGRDLPPNT